MFLILSFLSLSSRYGPSHLILSSPLQIFFFNPRNSYHCSIHSNDHVRYGFRCLPNTSSYLLFFLVLTIFFINILLARLRSPGSFANESYLHHIISEYTRISRDTSHLVVCWKLDSTPINMLLEVNLQVISGSS